MTRKVALVTGAGSGIGRAIACRLAAEGVVVAAADVDVDSARRTAASLEGGRAYAVNVTSPESVTGAVQAVVRDLGGLTALVNCAGVISLVPFEELTVEEWDRVLAVNLRGTFLCCAAAVPHLRAAEAGRIVNIASDLGKRGEELQVHYCASKFGVVGLTQALALELAPHGVTVNSICPAITDTPMMRRVADDLARLKGRACDEAFVATLYADIPMGRPARPEDVANAAAFLVDERSGFVTGQSINVTGGAWMS
jgi:NAD(P)-dependent dehydrogenase (short-subunit alcohol dehydrogenase family)